MCCGLYYMPLVLNCEQEKEKSFYNLQSMDRISAPRTKAA